jgi:hypothetical protein
VTGVVLGSVTKTANGWQVQSANPTKVCNLFVFNGKGDSPTGCDGLGTSFSAVGTVHPRAEYIMNVSEFRCEKSKP